MNFMTKFSRTLIRVVPVLSVPRTKQLITYLLSNYKPHMHTPLISPFMCSLAYCYQKSDETSPPKSKLSEIQYLDRLLTHEHLIKQACSLSVNSATQLLTQTLVAITDTAQLYRDALTDLMKLLDESMERTLHGVDQSDLTDLLVAARSKVTDLKKSLMELNSLMESVEKLVESTAEAAFVAGSDVLCNAMSDRLHSAKQELAAIKTKIKQMEEECLKLQQAIVCETAQREKKKKDREK